MTVEIWSFFVRCDITSINKYIVPHIDSWKAKIITFSVEKRGFPTNFSTHYGDLYF